MRALWLEERVLSFRPDLAPPNPASDEAVVGVRLAGICATDLELLDGYYPFTGIPGHEFVGQIVALPPGAPEGLMPGDRVVGEINLACGKCATCLAGRSTHCQRRKVLGIRAQNGAFAEYLTLPLENLHRVPDGLSDESAVFTEPLAAALEILQQVSIRPTDRVLVVGAGRLGQLVAQVLALTGCELVVAARHPRAQAVLAAGGIAVRPSNDTPDGWADIVVEATGAPAGFDLARRAVRPRGVIVLKSTYTGVMSLNLSALVVDEITLVGSRCGPFPPALRLLETGQVDAHPLVEAVYPLEEGLAAFERSAEPGVMKVLLQI